MRQGDGENRSPSRGGTHLDLSVVSFDNLFGDGQSQTGAAGLVGGERRKESLQNLGRHAAAVIGDADNDLIQILPGRKGDAVIPGRGLEGILQKIQEGLL